MRVDFDGAKHFSKHIPLYFLSFILFVSCRSLFHLLARQVRAFPSNKNRNSWAATW